VQDNHFMVFWDPVLGCTKISPACLNCIGESTSRLADLHPKYKQGFTPRCNPAELERILYLEKVPHSHICVAGSSDLFHEAIEEHFIFEVLNLIKRLPKHSFQVTTKRSERMMALSHRYDGFPKNLQVLVTVETYEYYHRIYHLQKAKVMSNYRGLSLKPLLSNMPKIPLNKINAVFIGRECNTHEPRITKQKWIMEVWNQCHGRKISYGDIIDENHPNYSDCVNEFLISMVFQLGLDTGGLAAIPGPAYDDMQNLKRRMADKILQLGLYPYLGRLDSLLTEAPAMLVQLAQFVKERKPDFFYETE
jgi:protein gp37